MNNEPSTAAKPQKRKPSRASRKGMLSFIRAEIALVVQDHPEMLSMELRRVSPYGKCYPPYAEVSSSSLARLYIVKRCPGHF
nr:MAG TPA: DVL family [Caudoviricetes sp.]